MRRGILAVLALCATVFVQPAEATQTLRTGPVYEVVRAPSAPAKSTVRVHFSGTGGPVDLQYVVLVPDGGGYSWSSAGGFGSSGGSGWLETVVDLSGGRRFVVGAVGARLRVETSERGWSGRKSDVAYRMVTATPATTGTVAGVPVEETTRATATAGPYGSFATATVRCTGAAGSWTFGTETQPPVQETCVSGTGRALDLTRRGRRWTVESTLSGAPLRRSIDLAVLDIPKR